MKKNPKGRLRYSGSARERERNRESEGSLERVFEGIAGLAGAFQKGVERLTPEKRAQIDNVRGHILASIDSLTGARKVLAVPGCIVTYRLTVPQFEPEEIEAKLREIVQAYPDADLTKPATALGIEIVDVQRNRPGQELSLDKPKKPGIRISYEE